MRRPGFCLCLLVLTGCGGPNSALDPASDAAAHFMDIWTIMLWVCGIAYALMLLFLGGMLWRARRQIAAPANGSSGGMRLALYGWIGFIVLGLALLTVSSYVIDSRLATQPSDALRIKITAAQWWWRIDYEGAGASERLTLANELHLPIGRAVRIVLVSDDVIHSFWIPNLGGKMDVIPSRTNELAFTPLREGRYRGKCAEFCGLQHAQMGIEAVVESPEAFEAWRKAQLGPAPPPSDGATRRGRALLVGGACAACHRIGGTNAMGATGPDLTHLASRRWIAAGARPNTPDDLRAWLMDPQAIKPGNHMPVVGLKPAQLDDLVAYLGSLK